MLNNVYSLGCPSKIIGNGVVYILNILKIKNAHNSIYNTCIAYAIQYTSKLGLTQCPVRDKCSEFPLTSNSDSKTSPCVLQFKYNYFINTRKKLLKP